MKKFNHTLLLMKILKTVFIEAQMNFAFGALCSISRGTWEFYIFVTHQLLLASAQKPLVPTSFICIGLAVPLFFFAAKETLNITQA